MCTVRLRFALDFLWLQLSTTSSNSWSRLGQDHSILGSTLTASLKSWSDCCTCITRATYSRRLLGVNKVVIYNISSGPELDRLLHSYSQEGFLEIVPWPINWHLTLSRNWRFSEGGGDLHYFGQLTTLNECIYRSMHQSRYVLLNDLDQIIMPYQHDDLPSLMSDLQRQHPDIQPFVSSLQVGIDVHVRTHAWSCASSRPASSALKAIYFWRRTWSPAASSNNLSGKACQGWISCNTSTERSQTILFLTHTRWSFGQGTPHLSQGCNSWGIFIRIDFISCWLWSFNYR